MRLRIFSSLLSILLVSSCATTRSNNDAKPAAQRLPVKCMENSPERRGEEGCTILADRPWAGSRTDTLYWHLDRFDSLTEAMKLVGPTSVAAEAHGYFWLMSVEAKAENHHGGHHVAWIGPLLLPAADHYSMRVMSSLLMPGSTTPVHTHSGPELFYIVDGEQCLDTPEKGYKLSAGQVFIIPGGGVHRGRVIGDKPRRSLALILYDAAYAASRNLENPPSLVLCK